MGRDTLAVTAPVAVAMRPKCAPALVGLLAALILLCLPAADAHAAILTVTTDNGGAPAVDGLCSLREAIDNARNNGLFHADCLVAGDAAPTLDEIRFNIGGGGVQTIASTGSFGTLTGGPMLIDATTQPGGAAPPRIPLDGVGAGAGATGFTITGPDVTVRGFALVRFDRAGIVVTAGAQRATIEGNHIGVDRTGAVVQSNGTGIEVDSAFTLQIGGTTAGQRNLISGNTGAGVRIASLNGGTIQGNVIGTDINGTFDISNNGGGIHASGNVFSLTIGGTGAGAGNLISGNLLSGIFLDGNGVTGVVIEGNRIGTNLAGSGALPNKQNGVQVRDAENTRIGGTTAGAGNLISGNASDGILLTDNANGNQIHGNLIGTNAAGTAAVHNDLNGIRIDDARGNVGDGTVASRNIISGNRRSGIVILSVASNVGIRSNYIGTNLDGTAAVSNGIYGIEMEGTNHAVGGNTVAAGNVISGNRIGGISFANAQLVDVRSNLIGTDATGVNPLGNGFVGIEIAGSNRIDIGNPSQAGQGNTVAFNGSRGVSVFSGDRIGIVDNRIFGNGQLGIDLSPLGVTANDQGDGDAGANALQNFPVIQTAESNGTTTVTGALNTTANTNGIRIQVFSNAACDPSGHGEGQRFLGEVTVNTDGNGNANWQIANLPAVGVGAVITATASSPSGLSFNTSEFSACFTATGILPPPPPPPGPGPTPTPTPGPVDPTDPANNNGNSVGQPKNEKADDGKQETEEQQRQRERTNHGNRDDDHTEGNVVAVDLEAGPPTATIATRDGLQVIVLLCRDGCDDPQVGDYLEADGVKEHEGLFYADSVTSRPPGRRR